MTRDENEAPAAEAQILADQGKSRLHMAMVILGPLGLAIDIFLSLWVSHLHVTHSVSVQVEPTWVVGEQLAVRSLLVDNHNQAFEGVEVDARYVGSDGTGFELGKLAAVDGGVSQGTIVVPETALGSGHLELAFETPAGLEGKQIVERVPVTVAESREVKEPTVTVAGSMLQWADDTDPQPETMRIDLRPHGRILAGFRNTFLVRVTDPEGVPHSGSAEVALISGEFAAKKGKEVDPPVLYSGPLDALGMVVLTGDLTSDVVRFEVRLPPEPSPQGESDAPETDSAGDEETSSEAAAEAEPITRRFRLVSFAGGVRVDAGALAARPGDELEMNATALSAKRPIFVDVHGPDGAWVDTLSPPLRVGSDARPWTVPETWADGGLAQFEAYHFTTSPDESSAVARLQVAAGDVSDETSLAPLIRRQRELLDSPRIERDFDVARERKYLDHLERADLATRDVERARTWLIGSLPVGVHGPPLAVNTRAREDEALADHKTKWILGLRWFLLGGGTLFLVVMGVSLWRSNQELGKATAEALGADEAGDADVEVVGQLVQAKRQMAARGLIVIAFMTAALLLTIGLLESLVWVV